MNYLEELNSEQKKAVSHKDGALLVLAGAGAGKTRVITYRILHLIKEGVAPESILAVTFTNKAAKEMSERVEELLKEDKSVNFPVRSTDRPYISTFHALGVRILRDNAEKCGMPRHFSIYDKSDSIKAIKESLKSADLDPKQFEPKMILNMISRQKGNGVSEEQYERQMGNDFFPRIVSAVWNEYEKLLKREKAFDFDDLLLKTMQLLKTNNGLRKKYQKQWDYIHIDEYQDTNKVQYEISDLLAQNNGNICVVGDIDQNIYSWRGADIENILHFEKNYPNSKTILLEENYRSTKKILEASNNVIKKNKKRFEKNLFTKNASGEKLTLIQAYDEKEEAGSITSVVEELLKKGVEPRDIAILYRTNFQSRNLEEAFLDKQLPYQVLGVRFFERKEIKDTLSFIRASLNPESLSDIKRIINVPPRGIGKVTLFKFVENKEIELSKKAQENVELFKEMLSDIKETALSKKPSETVKYVLSRTGLEKTLMEGGEEEHERLENCRELATFALRYDNLSPEEGIEKLLEDVALAADQDELKKESNAVRLMTVHASKGLEFEYVFIAGLEDGLFPHHSSDETVDDEEERRLFYVALTRARRKVFLSYASIRTIFGSREVTIPSEFITDIDDHLIDELELPTTQKEKIIYID